MSPQGSRGDRIFAALLLPLWFLVAGLPLLALIARVGPGQVVDALGRLLSEPSTMGAVRFGLEQAAGSLVVALAVGLPGAWLVARYRFPGRTFLRAMMVVPFCMPPVLVALGFALYYGRNGFLNASLMAVLHLSEPPLPLLYSFIGLCVVHGFYNFPLILDMVGSALERLSPTRAMAARSLGASRFRAFLTATLPAIAPAIAEAASLAFLFSFFSFVVVLLFGPLGASTPETEIWRRLRLEGDMPAATAFAIIQTLLALAVLAVFAVSAGRLSAHGQEKQEGRAPARRGPLATAIIALYGIFITAFFIAPIFSIGLASLSDRQAFGPAAFPSLGSWRRILESGILLRAIVDTAVTALPAAALATTAGFFLGSRLSSYRRTVDTFANLPLAISGVVAAAGWHIVFPDAALGLVILVQALAALPFSLRSSTAALATLSREPELAARGLGASRLRALLGVGLPAVLPVTLSSAAFSFALAAGDATTPLVLGLSDFEPLPLAIYRLAGAYRYPEACALGVVLVAATGLVFWFKGRGTAGA